MAISDYNPVAIEWRDSSSIESGWVPKDSINDLRPSECLSVGFILSEDKERIVICPHLSNTNQSSPMVNGGMVILKKQITRIHKL